MYDQLYELDKNLIDKSRRVRVSSERDRSKMSKTEPTDTVGQRFLPGSPGVEVHKHLNTDQETE